jgi:uncharacterized protein YegP (UPF0339 family)
VVPENLGDWVELIRLAIAEDLGPPGAWPVSEGYPGSLALATIDSIQSLGVRYAGVTKLIGRYRAFRAGQGADADTDGAAELRQSFDDLGGIEGWMQRIGNRQRVFARMDAPLKAEVIRDAADLLIGLGVDTAVELRALPEEEQEELKQRWLALKSQSSGISYRYLLMLVGEEGVKPDRMILRYLSSRLPEQPVLSLTEAVELLRLVAADMGVSLSGLDHAIWQYQRFARSTAVARDRPGGTFEIYKDRSGTFGWRLKSASEEVLVDSGPAYSASVDAERNAGLVRDAASRASIKKDS